MTVTDATLSEITDFLENPSGLDRVFPEFSEESLSALYAMGYELYRNGKYEDAKNFFRILTLADSFERKYWMGLAACLQMLKDYNNAIESYSAAAIQDPSDPYAHWHAADCYFQLGNLSKAKEALESALITAQDHENADVLIPKFQLIAETWSCLSKEGSHDR